MGKDIAKSKHAAGGGNAHSFPADMDSDILKKAIEKIYVAARSGGDGGGLHEGLGQGSSVESFTRFLADPKNSILALPDLSKKDWSRPLNEYFISSSHNTYLTGNQLYGSSTTAGYINVLSRGCKCIEIDVWDGDDDEPEVFHGYTLTKEIKFKTVCEAIRDYAFTNEQSEIFEGTVEGPVMISLECHTSAEQQRKMVSIMEKAWGDMLIRDIEPEDVKNLPSPLALKRKILVKVKYIAPEAPPGPAVVDTIPHRTPSNHANTSSSDSEHDSISAAYKKKKPKNFKIIRPLARLGAYCSSHHFPGASGHLEPFTSHPTSLIPNHVYSFSEKVFAHHHEYHASAIFSHNKRFLMRIYPSGLRFSSSNADPIEFWRRGVQLVALNWQKCDEGMMLNEGLFAGEGGYVLKPPGFRPNDSYRAPTFHTLDLSIDVIAGAHLPMPDASDTAKSFDPYVKVIIHTPCESTHTPSPKKHRTKAKRGTSCVWDQKLEFKSIPGIIEKLTFVRFKVQDEEFGIDDLAAWACIRLDRLQQGHRLVRLFDNQGMHSKGVLLVNVVKKVY